MTSFPNTIRRISPRRAWLERSASLELTVGVLVIIVTAILFATPTPN